MDEPTVVARGHRAFNELEEVGAAFERVRQVLLDEIAQCPVGSDSKILKLHMSVQNLAAVKKALQDTINNGLVAQAARDAIAVHGLTRP